MSQYRLHYFSSKCRAEGIRYILEYAKVPYENLVMPFDKYPVLKRHDDNILWMYGMMRSPTDKKVDFNSFRMGKLPVLEELASGKTWLLSQSSVIARYLAKKYDLVGDNEHEAAECDEVVTDLNDLLEPAARATFATENLQWKQDIRSKLVHHDFPRILGNLTHKLNDNSANGLHIVGKRWTYADLAICWIIEYLSDHDHTYAMAFEEYPELMDLMDAVHRIEQIAKYIGKRPTYEEQLEIHHIAQAN